MNENREAGRRLLALAADGFDSALAQVIREFPHVAALRWDRPDVRAAVLRLIDQQDVE